MDHVPNAAGRRGGGSDPGGETCGRVIFRVRPPMNTSPNDDEDDEVLEDEEFDEDSEGFEDDEDSDPEDDDEEETWQVVASCRVLTS